MSNVLKSKTFLLILAIVVQFLIYIPYFVDVPAPMKTAESELLRFAVNIASFAMLVGVYTATRKEIIRIGKRQKGWIYGVWVLILIWVMIIAGLVLGQTTPIFKFLQDSMLLPGDATIYSIVLFYMISAAGRAFRLRDTGSSLLLIVVVLVLLQQAPIAAIVWDGFVPIGNWLNNYLGMSISRTFAIVTALGGIILAVRFLSGKEMGMVGVKKEEGK
jgi:hypothetical protein